MFTSDTTSMFVLILCVSTMLASNHMTLATNIDKESVDVEQMSPRSALTRFLFYNARPAERQAAQPNGPFGYKRSSSALDALTGVTLGKRAAPMELVNLEPIFGRQYTMRSVPRMYDLRWAPLDSYNGPVGLDMN